MIISHSRRFVYLGIPRTANRATHAALGRLPGAFQHGLLHNMEIPADCRGYFSFCCVRNPYRRTLAYYLWRRMPHPWGCEAEGMSFAEYLTACEERRMGPCSLREFTGNNRLDTVFRYEQLPDSLYELQAQLGVEIPRLPPLGRRLSRHWFHYYTPVVAARVYALARGDFEEFGYDRDSWMVEPENSSLDRIS